MRRQAGHAAGELPNVFHLLRLMELFLRLFETQPVGDVTRDFGEADESWWLSSHMGSITALAQIRIPSVWTRKLSDLDSLVRQSVCQRIT